MSHITCISAFSISSHRARDAIERGGAKIESNARYVSNRVGAH